MGGRRPASASASDSRAVRAQHDELADMPIEGLARKLDLPALEAHLAKQQDAITKLIQVHKRDMADCKVVLSEAKGQTRGFQ